MKTEIGFKEFKKIVREKIRPVSMDLVSLLPHQLYIRQRKTLVLVRQTERSSPERFT